MLGHRDPQRSLFEAQAWPHRVPADSFYAQMGAVNEELFRDEDLAGMYSDDTGRPSCPPSLMSSVQLLQFYEDVSDEEAVQRMEFDIRWKVALNLPLDFVPPHPTTLGKFRQRLLVHSQERYAFNRLIQVGRQAGFLPDKISVLVDTLAQHGAGAVQNTYTLIRKGIRRVLKVAGYHLPARRRGLAANLAAYLDTDRKANIDWADPAARTAQLKVLIQDAEAVLETILPQADDPEVRSAAWLLTKILGDDVTTDEHGEPHLGQGVAEDRIVSLTDVEMRHGRKSVSQRFDGRKLQVAEEPTSELIVDIQPIPANVSDGRDLMKVVETIEDQHGLTVERVVADGAYGTGDNRAACQAQKIDVVSPLSVAHDSAVAKTAFQIDLQAGTVTCPQGQTATHAIPDQDSRGRPVQAFYFDRATCEVCPLFQRCVRSKTTGRSISLNFHEPLLQAARQRQQTDEFKIVYKTRAAVERKIAELTDRGIKQARYIGTELALLQALWTAAALNLRRLFKLFKGDRDRMSQILGALT